MVSVRVRQADDSTTRSPSPASFDAGSRRSVREFFDRDSDERRGIGPRQPARIARGEPGLVRQRLVPGGEVRFGTSDAVHVLTGNVPFRARLRGQPERFAELTAAKPQVIGWPCRRPGYRGIRPYPPPDNGTEGSTTQMGAPRRDVAQNRCPTAGFAGFGSEFVGFSGVAVSTVDATCHAAPDLPHCQRVFSPMLDAMSPTFSFAATFAPWALAVPFGLLRRCLPLASCANRNINRRAFPCRAESRFRTRAYLGSRTLVL